MGSHAAALNASLISEDDIDTPQVLFRVRAAWPF